MGVPNLHSGFPDSKGLLFCPQRLLKKTKALALSMKRLSDHAEHSENTEKDKEKNKQIYQTTAFLHLAQSPGFRGWVESPENSWKSLCRCTGYTLGDEHRTQPVRELPPLPPPLHFNWTHTGF